MSTCRRRVWTERSPCSGHVKSATSTTSAQGRKPSRIYVRTAESRSCSAHSRAGPTSSGLYGRGSFIRPGEAEFDELRGRFGKDRTAGQRSIVLIDLDRVQESCGYSVPKMALVEQRDILDLYQEKKGPEAYVDYGQQKNAVSIDGFPALDGL